MEPEQPSADCERLLLNLVPKQLPPTRGRAVMYEASSARNGNQPPVGTERRVLDWPICRKVSLGYLDVLPHIRLRADHTHVWLVCTAIYEHPIILLKKCVSCVILGDMSVCTCYRDESTNRAKLSSRGTFSERHHEHLCVALDGPQRQQEEVEVTRTPKLEKSGCQRTSSFTDLAHLPGPVLRT